MYRLLGRKEPGKEGAGAKKAGGKSAPTPAAVSRASSVINSSNAEKKSVPKRRKREMSDVFAGLDDLFARPAKPLPVMGGDEVEDEEDGAGDETETMDQVMKNQRVRDAVAARQRQIQDFVEEQKTNPLKIVLGGNASRGTAPQQQAPQSAPAMKAAAASRQKPVATRTTGIDNNRSSASNPFAFDADDDHDTFAQPFASNACNKAISGLSELALHHRRQEDAVELLLFNLKIFTNALSEHDPANSSNSGGMRRETSSSIGEFSRSSSSSSSVSSPTLFNVANKRNSGQQSTIMPAFRTSCCESTFANFERDGAAAAADERGPVAPEVRERLLRLLNEVVKQVEAETVVLRWAHRSGMARQIVDTLCSAVARYGAFWVHIASSSSAESVAFRVGVTALLTAIAHAVPSVPASTESFYAAALLAIQRFSFQTNNNDSSGGNGDSQQQQQQQQRESQLSKAARENDSDSDEDIPLGDLVKRTSSSSLVSTTKNNNSQQQQQQQQQKTAVVGFAAQLTRKMSSNNNSANHINASSSSANSSSANKRLVSSVSNHSANRNGTALSTAKKKQQAAKKQSSDRDEFARVSRNILAVDSDDGEEDDADDSSSEEDGIDSVVIASACRLLSHYLDAKEWLVGTSKPSANADDVTDDERTNDGDVEDCSSTTQSADQVQSLLTRAAASASASASPSSSSDATASIHNAVHRFVSCLATRALVHGLLSRNVGATVGSTSSSSSSAGAGGSGGDGGCATSNVVDASVPAIFSRQGGWMRCGDLLSSALFDTQRNAENEDEHPGDDIICWDPVVGLSTLVELVVSDPSAATFLQLRWLAARGSVIRLVRFCFRLLLADASALAAEHADVVLASGAPSQAASPAAAKRRGAGGGGGSESPITVSSSSTPSQQQQQQQNCLSQLRKQRRDLRLNRAQALLRCLMNISRVAPLATALDSASDFPVVRDAFLTCLRVYRSDADDGFVDLFSLCACCATALLMPPRVDKRILVHSGLRNALLGTELELMLSNSQQQQQQQQQREPEKKKKLQDDENDDDDDDDGVGPTMDASHLQGAELVKNSVARIAASAMFSLRHGRAEVGRNVAAAYAAALLAALSLGDVHGARMAVLRCLVAAARHHGASNQLGSTPMAYVVAVLQEFILFQSSHRLLTRDNLVGLHLLIERAVKENKIGVSSESQVDDGADN